MSSSITTSVAPPLAVVFTLVTLSHNLTKVNKHSLSVYLEHLTPGEFKELRLNPLKNAIAIDTGSVLAMETLLHVTSICGISVCPYIPRGKTTSVAVRSDVDANITDEKLMKETSASQKMLYLCAA